MNNTGTYKFIKGRVIKVSDRTPAIKKIQDWKKTMNPQEEMRRGYESLERQGKLNQVNDREVWGNL